MELSTAVKPWLLRTLLERPDYGHVAYLDPDIRIFAPLEEVERRVAAHDVVLTPHFNKPLPRDGHKPAEEDILIAGSYNLGFIALRRRARPPTSCSTGGRSGSRTTASTNRRWAASSTSAGSTWCRGSGRTSTSSATPPTTSPTGTWRRGTSKTTATVATWWTARALRFFHFSGFDPRRPKDAEQASGPDQDRLTTRPCAGSAASTPRNCSSTATDRRSAGLTSGASCLTGSSSTARPAASTAR